MHSAFDYIFNSKIKDVAAGRVLAGWKDPNHGGIPPTYEDITTNKEQAKVFMNFLFSQHEDLSEHVIQLCFGSFLQFYDQFIKVLKEEPNSKFDDVNKHSFARRIENVLANCEVEATTFLAWQEEVKSAFRRKNYMALPLSEVSGALCDSRTIVQEIGDVKKHAAASFNLAVKTNLASEEARLQDFKYKEERAAWEAKVDLKLKQQNEKQDLIIEQQQQILKLLVGNSSPLVRQQPDNHVETPLPLCTEVGVVEVSTTLAPKRLKMSNFYEEVSTVISKCDLKDYIKHWIIDKVEIEYYKYTDDDKHSKAEKNNKKQQFSRSKAIYNKLHSYSEDPKYSIRINPLVIPL